MPTSSTLTLDAMKCYEASFHVFPLTLNVILPRENLRRVQYEHCLRLSGSLAACVTKWQDAVVSPNTLAGESPLLEERLDDNGIKLESAKTSQILLSSDF